MYLIIKPNQGRTQGFIDGGPAVANINLQNIFVKLLIRASFFF